METEGLFPAPWPQYAAVMAREGRGRIKGAPVRALLEYWEETHGTDSIRALRQRLPEDFARELVLDPARPGFGVLVGGWYSNEALGALLEDLIATTSPGRRADTLDAMADEVMGRTLNGVHKAVFRIVGSPELMRRKGQFFWNQQFDTGDVEVRAISPGHQIHYYKNWRGHHHMLCALSFGCVRPMFHMMGVQNCRVELISCVDRGGSECAAHIRWDA